MFVGEKIYLKKIFEKKEKEIQTKEIKNNLLEINLQIELLEKNNKDQEEKIKKIQDKINLENNLEKEKIKNKYRTIIKEEINELIEKNNIFYLIEEMQNNNQKNKLELHTLLLDKKSVMEKIEKLSIVEEKIKQLQEEKEQLLKDNLSIELAKQILEVAYQKMRENVTPRFTQCLSESIQKITDGNYYKVKMNDEEGIMVERKNGEYIPANRLSVGTIDQLYVSLRFSMIKELSKENLPIFLDEVFAYFDQNRLRKVFYYLQENFSNTQIFIFTCTNREANLLEEMHIPYHKIQM